MAVEPSSPGGGNAAVASPREAFAPLSTPTTSTTLSAAGTAAKVGAMRMVGWTFENARGLGETATSSRGLRPMHVRVSVRIHHASFLHPGLDGGGGRASTIGGGGRRGRRDWRFDKRGGRKSSGNNVAAGPPPGIMHFGSKKGQWKNPNSQRGHHHFGMKDDDSAHGKDYVRNKLRGKDLDGGGEGDSSVMDTSEAADIISGEAFRLSRDGIIQHHYALNNASQQPSPPADRPDASSLTSSRSPHAYRPGGNKQAAATAAQGNNNPSILNPYSASNPQDAARYYRECAERPKGYRRLVVSSAVPSREVEVTPPATTVRGVHSSSRRGMSTGAAGAGARRTSGRPCGGADPEHLRRTSTGSWFFEKDDDDAEEKGAEVSKNDEGNESLFDNVEYRYIGPPQTGPEFFQLLRHHGAATFGRYLPELACSVPNHSIGFEVRKASKSKRRLASTQPLVVEAPHVIWGDARDRMLGKIAEEGCPLIDSRRFEYVSNAMLDETGSSESLMVCGATLWVQNAPDDGGEGGSVSSAATTPQNYAKAKVKAEYYGGKVVDGMKEGLTLGVKGLTKGTKKTVHAAEEGTKLMVKGTKYAVEETKGLVERGIKLHPIPDDRELESISTTQTQAPNEEHRTRKRDKLKTMFNPKKMGTKLRRRPKGKSADGIGGSLHSIEDDDRSIGSKSAATDSGLVADAMSEITGLVADAAKGAAANDDFDTNVGQDEVVKTSTEELKELFTVVKPEAYVLVLDDIIDIRIVSFPDKDDVIAHFPISVASVMVQRSIEDRTEDPLKPSELTATLIQEPSALDLRWGVELKVTIRAVEVKPNIPRVVPRPKDVIDEEINKLKGHLKMLGKTPSEIKTDLRAKEEEIEKEEHDLNGAIIAYGYGKGEDEGAGIGEVRLRQMFYCEREHGAIARKMKRRTRLTNVERKMINDARIDPSSSNNNGCYSGESLKKLLEDLEVNFPGVEKEDANDNEATVLNTDETASAKESDPGTVNDSILRVRHAMAKSLDNCLGGLTKKPMEPVVKQKPRHTISEGISPQFTEVEAKEWCSKVAAKLSKHVSSANTMNVPIKSSIATIQSIIVESSLGSEKGLKECAVDEKEEEMKLNEDEVAMSEAKSSDSRLDSSKLVDWVNAVASQLAACAEELDDGQESLSRIDTVDSTPQVEEEMISYRDHGTSRNTINSSISGYEGDVERSGVSPFLFRPKQVPPLESHVSTLSYDGDIKRSGMVKRRNPPKKVPQEEYRESSVSSAEQRRLSPDEVLWDKVLSQKGRPKRSFSSSGVRHRNATSISTVKDALPSSNTQTTSQIEPLLKIANMSPVHQVKSQTSSLTVTLVYLCVTMTAFVAGVAVLFQICHFFPSMIQWRN